MRLCKYNKMVKRVVERRRRQEFGLWAHKQPATQSSLATTLHVRYHENAMRSNLSLCNSACAWI